MQRNFDWLNNGRFLVKVVYIGYNSGSGTGTRVNPYMAVKLAALVGKMTGRIPFLKHLAMASTVLATIFAVSSAQVHVRGTKADGGGLHAMLAGPMSARAPSTMAAAPAWHIMWSEYLAIGGLIFGLIGVTSRRRPISPGRLYQGRRISLVRRHHIRSIARTILRIQMPPPCCCA
jgi:hypothetical protein